MKRESESGRRQENGRAEASEKSDALTPCVLLPLVGIGHLESLAVTNRRLVKEILRRKAVEQALKKSEQHESQLLHQARHMQQQLRHLSQLALQAQEEERKRISRELHDQIAQALICINLDLMALIREPPAGLRDLKKRIASTQRLLEDSVNTLHRFTDELRPPVLDNLGLNPALRAYVKHLARLTGVHIRFRTFAGVEQMSDANRTVLYRVAQEVLTNIAQHSEASHAEVCIQKGPGLVRLEIRDNGKGFRVNTELLARQHKHLGLLGMKERVEMVGGRFSLESAPGRGTTVRAEIPFDQGDHSPAASEPPKAISLPATKPITVLLAEDHTIVSQGLRTLLEDEGGFSIVGEARTGREALKLTQKLRPAVVVMDIALPILNGIEATRHILKTVPGTRVLILSAHGDDTYVDQVTAAGAAGYLLKQSSLAALAHAIRQVHAGRTFYSPSISRRMCTPGEKSRPQNPSSGKQLNHLSPRELEVLQLVAEGQANKQIAAELGIAIKTVEKHRHDIMETLRIHHTAGLTRYALAAGLVESSAQVTIL